MKVKILFDKEAIVGTFRTGWGISYLVNEDVLFDTGEKFEYLVENSKLMGVDLQKVRKVVISHEHWDHTGGLWDLLTINRNITVYGCFSFGKGFKERVKKLGAKLIEVKQILQIGEALYSTGEFLTSYKGANLAEQGLIIEKGSKMILICGCCHPGLTEMLERVKDTFHKDIYCVLGGFHLMDKEKRFIEYIAQEIREVTGRIGPSHCTGFEAISIFKRVFGDNFVEIKVGKELEI